MKNFLLFLIFVPFLISGQQTINGNITHDNISRSYILYVPASYNSASPVPLVFCFHGYTSNSNANFSYTNFKSIADTAGFIVVHPQGTLDNNGSAHWNVGGWTVGSTVDDVGFTAALLDSISSNYNINADRVYSTGMSNGGYMSFHLACTLSDKFAAVASVTGAMTPQTLNVCNPLHPTPIMQIHGTADATVPYNGSPLWTMSINDILQYWVGYNNCNSMPTTTAVPNINITDGSTVEHTVYDGGDNGVNVEHFKVIGGGHDWPGVWGNQDINASIEVWKFFLRYNLSGLITSVSEDEVEVEINCFPNPVSDLFTIKNPTSSNKRVTITNLIGNVVYSGLISENDKQISLKHLSPNLYFVKVGDSVFKILKL